MVTTVLGGGRVDDEREGALTGIPAGTMSPERRAAAVRRLKAIEGQVRGLERMFEDGRPCLELMMQVASVQEALRRVGQFAMRNYLETCVTSALQDHDPTAAAQTYDDLMDAIYKYVR